jgi:hypothetical protein
VEHLRRCYQLRAINDDYSGVEFSGRVWTTLETAKAHKEEFAVRCEERNPGVYGGKWVVDILTLELVDMGDS